MTWQLTWTWTCPEDGHVVGASEAEGAEGLVTDHFEAVRHARYSLRGFSDYGPELKEMPRIPEPEVRERLRKAAAAVKAAKDIAPKSKWDQEWDAAAEGAEVAADLTWNG